MILQLRCDLEHVAVDTRLAAERAARQHAADDGGGGGAQTSAERDRVLALEEERRHGGAAALKAQPRRPHDEVRLVPRQRRLALALHRHAKHLQAHGDAAAQTPGG